MIGWLKLLLTYHLRLSNNAELGVHDFQGIHLFTLAHLTLFDYIKVNTPNIMGQKHWLHLPYLFAYLIFICNNQHLEG